jgi:hypothetical protein
MQEPQTDWFLDSVSITKVDVMPEGHAEEDISFIQKILGEDAIPYDDLYEMGDEDFEALVRRTHRTEYCGKVWRWIMWVDGSMRRLSYVCGNWRYCPNCRQERAYKYKGRLLSALIEKRRREDGNTLLLLDGSYNRRSIGKEHYVNFPIADGKSFIFTDLETIDSEPLRGISLAYDDLENLDWESIVNTPEGRRISGILGKPEEKEDTRIPVNVQSVVVKGETPNSKPLPDHIQEAYDWAIEKVSKHANVSTIDDIENATLQLAMSFRDRIREIGKEHDRPYTVIIQNWAVRVESRELEKITRIASWKAIQAKCDTQIPWGSPSADLDT